MLERRAFAEGSNPGEGTENAEVAGAVRHSRAPWLIHCVQFNNSKAEFRSPPFPAGVRPVEGEVYFGLFPRNFLAYLQASLHGRSVSLVILLSKERSKDWPMSAARPGRIHLKLADCFVWQFV